MGFNFERQIQSAIHVAHTISSKVDGVDVKLTHDRIVMEFQASRIEYYDNINEIEFNRLFSCLWINKKINFSCDGIIIPKFGGVTADTPIIVYDVSVSDPFSQIRIKKMKTLDNVRNDVATHLNVDKENIRNVLFWHKDISSATKSNAETKSNFPLNTFLVDESGARKMGVKI
jgi:hypothetical protein